MKIAMTSLAAFCIGAGCLAAIRTCADTPAQPVPTVEIVQHRAFDYFWTESDPKTGLTKDRATNIGDAPDTHTIASTAATGYALAALPIGVSHGWITKKQGYDRALTTLRFVHDKLPNSHGFYYHFIDIHTGERQWKCEISSIDTALLLLGARVAGDYWPDTAVSRLADELTDQADWRWMQTEGGTTTDQTALAMGWKPEDGWINARWQGYSEASFLYWLALGSKGHPVAASAWDNWNIKTTTLEGYAVFGGAKPLFMAQMAPGFFNVQGMRDRQGRDWWTAWKNAHLADHAYCKRNPQKCQTYAQGFWGLSANDQPPPVGYGACAPADGRNDGTVSPTAMLAGMIFTPDLSKAALANLWQKQGSKLWGRYGFSNAFNVDKSWYDTDVVGIDLGMMLLSLENSRTRMIWNLMKSDPVLTRGLAAAGFHMPAAKTIKRPSADAGGLL